MADYPDFDHDVRNALRGAASTITEPAGLAERLIAGAATAPAARQRGWNRSTATRRLLPPLLVAAAVAAVAIATTAIVTTSQADHGKPTIPPAQPTNSILTNPTPGAPTSVNQSPVVVAPAPSVSNAPTSGPVPAGFKPYSATFIDAEHGWVLGGAACGTQLCSSIARTTDGGRTWQDIAAPDGELGTGQNASAPAISSLRFADPLNGWAFGGALYSTHDGGQTWSRQPIAGNGSALWTSAVEAGGGFVEALVDKCSAYSPANCVDKVTVYRSPVGTDAWTDVSGAVSQIQLMSLPALLVNGQDWWVSVGSATYHGHGGSKPVRLTVPGQLLAVADPRHLDSLSSTDGGAGSTTQQLYGTIDGGAHWAPSGPAYRGPSDVTGGADNTQRVLLISESSGDSEIRRTTDDGQHFTTVLNPSLGAGGTPWTDLAFPTPAVAVAVLTGLGVFMSHDAGATWNLVTL